MFAPLAVNYSSLVSNFCLCFSLFTQISWQSTCRRSVLCVSAWKRPSAPMRDCVSSWRRNCGRQGKNQVFTITHTERHPIIYSIRKSIDCIKVKKRSFLICLYKDFYLPIGTNIFVAGSEEPTQLTSELHFLLAQNRTIKEQLNQGARGEHNHTHLQLLKIK